MKKTFPRLLLAVNALLLICHHAFGQITNGIRIGDLPLTTNLSGNEIFPVSQMGGTVGTQLKTITNGLATKSYVDATLGNAILNGQTNAALSNIYCLTLTVTNPSFDGTWNHGASYGGFLPNAQLAAASGGYLLGDFKRADNSAVVLSVSGVPQFHGVADFANNVTNALTAGSANFAVNSYHWINPAQVHMASGFTFTLTNGYYTNGVISSSLNPIGTNWVEKTLGVLFTNYSGSPYGFYDDGNGGGDYGTPTAYYSETNFAPANVANGLATVAYVNSLVLTNAGTNLLATVNTVNYASNAVIGTVSFTVMDCHAQNGHSLPALEYINNNLFTFNYPSNNADSMAPIYCEVPSVVAMAGTNVVTRLTLISTNSVSFPASFYSFLNQAVQFTDNWRWSTLVSDGKSSAYTVTVNPGVNYFYVTNTYRATNTGPSVTWPVIAFRFWRAADAGGTTNAYNFFWRDATLTFKP